MDVHGRRRVICCHRATLSGRFPPNSLAAIEECVEARVPRLEIDVRFLSDDAMLIFHDDLLDRETTGSGPVGALDRATAARLRYREDETHGLCFLAEVADAMKAGETLLQVDLKLMRPLSKQRLDLLAAALEPIRDRCLIGSQAHWNLRPLAGRGFRVALDPTLQWHYLPGRDPSLTPSLLGVHGLWDDAPLAHIRHASALDYLEARLDALAGLPPRATEWMVDVRTIDHLATLGLPLGEALLARGVELAAWTLRDYGAVETPPVLERLFQLGTTTVIADDAPAIARYAAALSAQRL